jgi:hypothetical protein
LVANAVVLVGAVLVSGSLLLPAILTNRKSHAQAHQHRKSQAGHVCA